MIINPYSFPDPDTTAFAAASGATDLSGIDALARYMRQQGLRSNYRLYPQKSAQNAGSGATVYGIGALTANNMTLVASPTWGASGIVLDGSTQFGRISDFLGTETITMMQRGALTSTAGNKAIIGQYDTGLNQRSVYMANDGTLPGYSLSRSVDGNTGSGSLEVWDGGTVTAADTVYVGQWEDGGGRGLWLDKAGISLSLNFGTAQTSKYNSPADVTVGAILSSGGILVPQGGTFTASMFITGALTTTQRETITDLINAL